MKYPLKTETMELLFNVFVESFDRVNDIDTKTPLVWRNDWYSAFPSQRRLVSFEMGGARRELYGVQSNNHCQWTMASTIEPT